MTDLGHWEMHYEALDSRGRRVRGIVVTDSVGIVTDRLEQMGYRPVFVGVQAFPDMTTRLSPGQSLFRFKATDRTGTKRRGVTIATCEGEARSTLARMAMTHLSIQPLGRWGLFWHSLISTYAAASARARMSD